MGTLWGNKTLESRIEAFTVGRDHHLDQRLLPYDCTASIAHARMLGKVGLLLESEVESLIAELQELRTRASQGDFTIDRRQEDGHTAIEQALVQRLGDIGKKIHLGRSRNDQVLTAMRLYTKDVLSTGRREIQQLRQIVEQFAEAHAQVPMPGFTHTRKAMPSTVGIWGRSLGDALGDDIVLLDATFKLVDQSPLGTGAGYGIPLSLDRQMTADELGFARIQSNPIYAQSSRGKFECTVLHCFSQVMLDFNRIASDLIWYSMPGFGFFKLPESHCTGSSIMPQKQNPDVLELIRNRYHEVLSCQFQLSTSLSNMIQGYHRDLQGTKEPFLRAIDVTLPTVSMMTEVFRKLEVDEEACSEAMTPELFATERAYKLVTDEGMTFRDAYIHVKKELLK